jgi:mannan endo-1,4-beta-mannosidase
VEVHDTTGFGERSKRNAASLNEAVDYWISIQSALVGQEAYVAINIGNEPYGNRNPEEWTQATIDAIGRMRAAGFDHLLVVDAPNWGQDWRFIMRDNAPAVFASDPQGNTLFSIHMYGVFDEAQKVSDYFQAFQDMGLPLVVGEFGHDHLDGDPDEAAIMAEAQARGVGYLGWSWSGNSKRVAYLDMTVDFDVTQLTFWGELIHFAPNGIVETSVEATIYGG